MKVYLAAAYQRRHEMRRVRDDLHAMGYQVTSTWLDDDVTPVDGMGTAQLAIDPEHGRRCALRDIAQLAEADTVISFTDGLPARGGRHVEFGMAYAWGRRLILVGPMENVFHVLGLVDRYPDWPTLAHQMQFWARDMRDAPDKDKGV